MKKVDLKTFSHLLSVHGADLSRWPDVDVREVLAFIESNVEAKAEFEQASALDAALLLYAVPEIDSDKIALNLEGVETEVPAYAQRKIFPAMVRMSSRAGLGLALCLFAMMAGVFVLQSRTETDQMATGIVVASNEAAQPLEIDDVLVIAAADIREQQQMQELLELLKSKPKSESDGSLDDAVNQLLLDEYTIDDLDIQQMFSEG